MTRSRLQELFSNPTRRRINRAPSPLFAQSVPWLSIALLSLAPAWPVIASAPVLPPFGFLMLLAWRQMRPGLLPPWAGLPLGIFDDLFSGQPFGSAILLWSVAILVLEAIETRVPWRNFLLDWLLSGIMVAVYLMVGAKIAMGSSALPITTLIMPQLLLSLLVFPLIGRFVSMLDRFRLIPLRTVA